MFDNDSKTKKKLRTLEKPVPKDIQLSEVIY
jgi:hypothetical protein